MQQVKAQNISGSGHKIEQSLLFSKDAPNYLTKNFSGGNPKKWTFSVWLKSPTTFDTSVLCRWIGNGSNYGQFVSRSNQFRLEAYKTSSWNDGSSSRIILDSMSVDEASWYHFVVRFDSAQANQEDRCRIYTNGIIHPNRADTIYPPQNSDHLINSDGVHYIGVQQTNEVGWRGYMSEFYFVDNQSLGPEHFALEASDGSYDPIPYEGEYGNTGFYLPFGESDPTTEFKTPGTHNYTVPDGVTELDILLVGGGGGGGFQAGGGGGAGGVEYHANVPVTPGQVIPLTVGEGGQAKKVSSGTVAQNGGATSILSYSVPGGGGGGDSEGPADWKNGRDGACGGGTGNGAKSTPGIPGTGSMGGDGGPDRTAYIPGNPYNAVCGGSGGGGMGGSGSTQKNQVQPNDSTTCSGQGGPGVYYGDKFSDKYGDRGWFASGGSGGGYTNPNMSPLAHKGGGGGGKNSNYGGDREGDAMDGTGGGALGNHQATPPQPHQSNGGSGVVLIKPSNSSVLAIGSDQSGNGNNFETYGLTSESVVADSPANNYCTLNPLYVTQNDTNCYGIHGTGNLRWTWDSSRGDGYADTSGTIEVSSGKWYYEVKWHKYVQGGLHLAFADPSVYYVSPYPMQRTRNISWDPETAQITVNGSSSSYGVTGGDGDIFGVGIDLDTYEFEGFINGESQGLFNVSGATSVSKVPYVVVYGTYLASSSPFIDLNFGQRPWAYDPPAGYKAICTNNLPRVSIKPEEHFKAVTYTGNGTSQSIGGVGFEPSLTWIKSRSVAGNHRLHNVITYGGPISGGSSGIKYLHSDTADKETSSSAKTLTSLDSDGFSLYGDGADTNQSGSTYVSWNLKAGGDPVPNYKGSNVSLVSVNTELGFSVVSYTGNGTEVGSFGHGLGKTPSLVICKNRDADYNWTVHCDQLGGSIILRLDTAEAMIYDPNAFQNRRPNYDVVHVGGSSATNGRSGYNDNMLAYCFTNTDMLRVGLYQGNGLADGAFVALPYKPAFVLTKSTNSAGNWSMIDNKRDPYNVGKQRLYADISNNESPGDTLDLLSNGFKCRESGGPNVGSVDFLYLAIAEEAFNIARGR